MSTRTIKVQTKTDQLKCVRIKEEGCKKFNYTSLNIWGCYIYIPQMLKKNSIAMEFKETMEFLKDSS